MNHRFTPAAMLLCLLLVALGWNAGLYAASTYTVHVPAVYGAPVASTCDGSAPILDQDSGSLAAVYQAGHWYVAYQDRAHGGRGHLAEHVGGALVEVVKPVGVAPSFSPPDSVKVGSVALATDGMGHGRWYYTSRVIDDTPNEGPYAVWCVEF